MCTNGRGAAGSKRISHWVARKLHSHRAPNPLHLRLQRTPQSVVARMTLCTEEVPEYLIPCREGDLNLDDAGQFHVRDVLFGYKNPCNDYISISKVRGTPAFMPCPSPVHTILLLQAMNGSGHHGVLAATRLPRCRTPHPVKAAPLFHETDHTSGGEHKMDKNNM